MRFRHIAVIGLLSLAPAAVPAPAAAGPPGTPARQGTPHDELHSRMEREHQQWHFAHDRGPRDRNWNREHARLHERLEQKHEQWHRQHAASGAATREGQPDRKARKRT